MTQSRDLSSSFRGLSRTWSSSPTCQEWPMRTPLKRPRFAITLTAAAGLSLVLSGCSSIGSSSSAQPTPSTTGTPKAGGTLTVGLSAEPDALDPTTSRTLVGRSVFTSICEKLYDINAQLQIVPELAAA